MRIDSRCLVLILTFATVGACTTETHRGPAEIKVPDYSERYATEAVHKILYNGNQVGTAWTRRALDGDSNDYNDVRQIFLKNMTGDTIGFVTEEMKGYRLRAHGEPEFVSNHPKLENNVLSVFGWNDGSIQLEEHTAPAN